MGLARHVDTCCHPSTVRRQPIGGTARRVIPPAGVAATEVPDAATRVGANVFALIVCESVRCQGVCVTTVKPMAKSAVRCKRRKSQRRISLGVASRVGRSNTFMTGWQRESHAAFTSQRCLPSQVHCPQTFAERASFMCPGHWWWENTTAVALVNGTWHQRITGFNTQKRCNDSNRHAASRCAQSVSATWQPVPFRGRK